MKNPDTLKIGDAIYENIFVSIDGNESIAVGAKKYKIADFLVRETTGEAVYVEVINANGVSSMIIFEMLKGDAWSKTKKKAPAEKKVTPKKKVVKKKKGKKR